MSNKVAIITLGCAKNTVDSEHIKRSLLDKGLEVTEQPETADHIIINTCGFIEAAKQESINTIIEAVGMKRHDRPIKVIVTGCLAQRYYKELAEEIPEIDALIGIAGEFDIAGMLADGAFKVTTPDSPVRDFSRYPGRSLSGLPYAYLQIADGCDNWCAYCAIPQIRGRFRSKPFETVLNEARMLDESGVTEIDLIAQDTSRYGADLYGRLRLPDLLDGLTGFMNIRWVRLLYMQPQNINDDLIEAIKANKLVVPYLDIPFQHASPAILKAMNRNGSGDAFLEQIARLRRMLPDIALRSSVILGFPGETDDDFSMLADFVEKAQLDHLGIFEYSVEEGTVAADIEAKIPLELITERYHQLTALQDSIGQWRNEQRDGCVFDVLVERQIEPGVYEGRGYWQAPEVDGSIFLSDKAAPPEITAGRIPLAGDIVKVTIDEFDGCDHHGRLISGPGK